MKLLFFSERIVQSSCLHSCAETGFGQFMNSNRPKNNNRLLFLSRKKRSLFSSGLSNIVMYTFLFYYSKTTIRISALRLLSKCMIPFSFVYMNVFHSVDRFQLPSIVVISFVNWALAFLPNGYFSSILHLYIFNYLNMYK